MELFEFRSCKFLTVDWSSGLWTANWVTAATDGALRWVIKQFPTVIKLTEEIRAFECSWNWVTLTSWSSGDIASSSYLPCSFTWQAFLLWPRAPSSHTTKLQWMYTYKRTPMKIYKVKSPNVRKETCLISETKVEGLNIKDNGRWVVAWKKHRTSSFAFKETSDRKESLLVPSLNIV